MITKDKLKFLQIDAAFNYLIEHPRSAELTDIYEFGVYKGDSLKKICDYAKENFSEPDNHFIWGFDSFEGLEQEKPGLEVFKKFYEGAYKFPLDEDPVKFIKKKINYKTAVIINRKFSELCKHSLIPIMNPVLLCHIDCDLMKPTEEALTFLFERKLLRVGSLIAYDEFRCGEGLKGEERAHKVILNKYKATSEEVWHYIYMDKDNGQKIRQSVFEITSIDSSWSVED